MSISRKQFLRNAYLLLGGMMLRHNILSGSIVNPKIATYSLEDFGTGFFNRNDLDGYIGKRAFAFFKAITTDTQIL